MKLVLIAMLAVLAYAAASAQTVTLLTPGPEEFPKGGFDRTAPIKVTGQIEKVDTLDGKRILWVSATKVVQASMGSGPGSGLEGTGNLWRVEGASRARRYRPPRRPRHSWSALRSRSQATMPTTRNANPLAASGLRASRWISRARGERIA